MSNFRYHVHVIQVVDEQPILSSQLVLFFEQRAFLTYDLPAMIPETSAYSRRCIDACDCVVMIVGDDYGKTNASGVSQMHLSYLTAKTKLKPILIFIKKPTNKSSRQVADFAKLLASQNTEHLYYYQHEPVFRQHLDNVYEEFEQSFTPTLWVRGESPVPAIETGYTTSLEQTTGNRNNKTVQSGRLPKETIKDSDYTSSMDTKTASKSTGDAYDVFLDEHIPIENKQSKSKRRAKSAANAKNKTKSKKMTSGTKLAASATESMRIENSDVQLSDELKINYRAHAYQAGNLSDVSLSLQLKWQDVVAAISKLGNRFSTENVYRCLNDLVAQYADEDVKKIMPDVHAVSRCQVSQIDVVWIHSQLRYNGWLEESTLKISERNPSNKGYWQLTEAAIDELCLLDAIN